MTDPRDRFDPQCLLPAGRGDALYSLEHPGWKGRALENDEIITLDLAGDRLSRPLAPPTGEIA